MGKSTAIYGPPGTGKTRYLVELLKRLTHDHKDSKIAVLSFSRAAAKELLGRIKADNIAFIGTIHSLCYRALKMGRGQVANEEEFIQFLAGDEDLTKVALQLYGLSRRSGKTLDEVYGESTQIDIPWRMLNFIIKSYENWKSSRYLMDFDDMLIKAVDVLDPYDIVVVDEAQDLSDLQWRVIDRIVGNQLYMAGDDDQAIYSWAGANPHGMAIHEGKVIILDQSYRVPATILNVAESIVNKISKRQHKEYKPRPVEGEVEYTTQYSTALHGNSGAILCRDRYVMREIEEELIHYAIPYRMEGMHGVGLFHGRYGKLIRAIHAGDIDTLQKSRGRSVFTPVGMHYLDLDEVPPDWRTALNIDDAAVMDYFDRVDLDSQEEIMISTIHAQKGKEHDHVVLISHCSPKVESLQDAVLTNDDELRVWYTAVTRAKNMLTIVGTNPYVGV